MSDDLYRSDALAWSVQQADLLRRVSVGERVNDLDWPNVIEEIEAMGRSELRACKTLLTRGLEHLLKIQGWAVSRDIPHRRSEASAFLRDARRAFSPLMRQSLDVDGLYRDALDAVLEERMDDARPAALPSACPFSADDLLGDPLDLDRLLALIGTPDRR